VTKRPTGSVDSSPSHVTLTITADCCIYKHHVTYQNAEQVSAAEAVALTADLCALRERRVCAELALYTRRHWTIHGGTLTVRRAANLT